VVDENFVMSGKITIDGEVIGIDTTYNGAETIVNNLGE
jgi:hypothetical protein